MSNYPPGVTGAEWQIGGYPDCRRCGHPSETHAAAHSNREEPSEEPCDDCDCEDYTAYLEGDPE